MKENCIRNFPLLRSLKREFNNLNFIVYQRRYLVPAPPRPVRTVFMEWSLKKTSEIRKLQKETPCKHIISQLVENFRANRQTDPEIIQLEKQQAERSKLFRVELANYRKNYVMPFSPPLSVYIYFSQVKHQSFLEGEYNKKKYFEELSKAYHSLTPEQLKEYKDAVNKINSERDEQYNEIRQRLLIPWYKSKMPFALYLSENMNSIYEIAELSRIWRGLPDQSKLEYTEKCKLINHEGQKILSDFLKPFGLTLPEFDRIVKVTKDYRKELTRVRKLRKSSKSETAIQADMEIEGKLLLPTEGSSVDWQTHEDEQQLQWELQQRL